jgi:hypothetical protein
MQIKPIHLPIALVELVCGLPPRKNIIHVALPCVFFTPFCHTDKIGKLYLLVHYRRRKAHLASSTHLKKGKSGKIIMKKVKMNSLTLFLTASLP